MFKERHVIVDSLKALNMPSLSHDAIHQSNQDVLQSYVKIIEIKSIELKRHDILERLWVVGLAY